MSERLTPAQVAKMIGISEYTLGRWMRRGEGPAFYRLSRTNIYFEAPDVEQWITQQKRVPPPKYIPLPIPERPGAFPTRFHGRSLRKQ